MLSPILLLIAVLAGFSETVAQLNVGGQASAAFIEAQDGSSQYS